MRYSESLQWTHHLDATLLVKALTSGIFTSYKWKYFLICLWNSLLTNSFVNFAWVLEHMLSLFNWSQNVREKWKFRYCAMKNWRGEIPLMIVLIKIRHIVQCDGLSLSSLKVCSFFMSCFSRGRSTGDWHGQGWMIRVSIKLKSYIINNNQHKQCRLIA